MSERDGFFFYRSFWDAINELPAKDQLPVLKAIILFGLDGTESEKLTPVQKAFFLLVRPVVAKGRNKAANGKKGGSKKKANGKQNESKTESASGLLLSDKRLESNPYGLRQETRDEREGFASALESEKAFGLFWEAYPKQICKDEALEAWRKLNPGPKDTALIMVRLSAWKQSKRWTEEEFIPKPENFLDPNREYLSTTPASAKQPVPKGASGQLGDAELEAIQRVLIEEVEA